MNILVMAPDYYGESQEMFLCDAHLSRVLAKNPLESNEYVLPADSDIACECCVFEAKTAGA